MDTVTDKVFTLKGNICVIYSAGDGYRLAENTSGGNFFHITNSTLSELYILSKNKFDVFVFKADPASSSEAYSFYSLRLDSLSVSKYELTKITELEYLHAIKSMHKIDFK